MKREEYRLILSLMLTSVLAMIAVQGYSLWQSFRQVKGDFERGVNQAISDFNYQLENESAYLSTLGDTTSYDLSMFNEDSSMILIYSLQGFSAPLQKRTIIPDYLKAQREAEATGFFDRLMDTGRPDSALQEVIVIKILISCDTCQMSGKLHDYYPMEEMLTAQLERQGLNIPFELGIMATYEDSVKWTYNSTEASLLTESSFQQDIFRNTHRLFLLFPTQRAFLWSKLTWSALWSLLLIVLVFGSFWFALRIIRRQKQLAELKSDFINNMTHEFKTPIATIAFATANIEHEQVLKDPVQVKNFTKVIREENKRMNHRVEQVLKAAVADRKAFKLNHERLNLVQLLNTLIQPLSLQLTEEGGKVHRDFPTGEVWISGDELHLGNLFSNLLDNARKYSPEKVDIQISIETSDRGVWVRVKDHGLGMSKEAQKRVFEQFYRVPTGNLHNIKGFGLGLAYAQTVAIQHGGMIEVESKLGRGSTFSVFIPHEQPISNEA